MAKPQPRGSKKGAPRSAGKRKKKGTHIRYRNKMFAAFTTPGRWDELGRKLKKRAMRGVGMTP